MNKIEQKFYDTFLEYVNSNPVASVYDISENNKIAEYTAIKEKDIDNTDIKSVDVHVVFNTFPDILKNICLIFYLLPQKDVNSYIVDFSLEIECIAGYILKFAIEIDGHNFHEKTKEQASNDKRRDREITSNDYIVLRFTGSEIYTNPIKCIQEIFNIAISLTYERILDYHEYYEQSFAYINNISKNGENK